MKCCLNDVVINDVPTFLVKNHMVNDHPVFIPSYADDTCFHSPAKLEGVTSNFSVSAAILSEYKCDNILKFH